MPKTHGLREGVETGSVNEELTRLVEQATTSCDYSVRHTASLDVAELLRHLFNRAETHKARSKGTDSMWSSHAKETELKKMVRTGNSYRSGILHFRPNRNRDVIENTLDLLRITVVNAPPFVLCLQKEPRFPSVLQSIALRHPVAENDSPGNVTLSEEMRFAVNVVIQKGRACLRLLTETESSQFPDGEPVFAEAYADALKHGAHFELSESSSSLSHIRLLQGETYCKRPEHLPDFCPTGAREMAVADHARLLFSLVNEKALGLKNAALPLALLKGDKELQSLLHTVRQHQKSADEGSKLWQLVRRSVVAYDMLVSSKIAPLKTDCMRVSASNIRGDSSAVGVAVHRESDAFEKQSFVRADSIDKARDLREDPFCRMLELKDVRAGDNRSFSGDSEQFVGELSEGDNLNTQFEQIALRKSHSLPPGSNSPATHTIDMDSSNALKSALGLDTAIDS